MGVSSSLYRQGGEHQPPATRLEPWASLGIGVLTFELHQAEAPPLGLPQTLPQKYAPSLTPPILPLLREQAFCSQSLGVAEPPLMEPVAFGAYANLASETSWSPKPCSRGQAAFVTSSGLGSALADLKPPLGCRLQAAWEGAHCTEPDLEGRGSLSGERKVWGGWEGAWEEDALSQQSCQGRGWMRGRGGPGAAGNLTQKPEASSTGGALHPATGHTPTPVCAQVPQTATFLGCFLISAWVGLTHVPNPRRQVRSKPGAGALPDLSLTWPWAGPNIIPILGRGAFSSHPPFSQNQGPTQATHCRDHTLSQPPAAWGHLNMIKIKLGSLWL